jgi:hypothetical protein
MRPGTDEGLRSACSAAALLLGSLLLAGCSSITGSSSGEPESPSVTSRMSSFFSSSSAPKDGVTRTATGAPASPDIECPGVDIRAGASTLGITAAKTNQPTAGDLRYQLSFNQTARECIVQPGTMTIKVGVQGRVVLGPAGGPGQVDIPLRYAVVREGPEPRTIVTRFKRVQATVGPSDLNIPFTDIDDGLTFPMPSLTELEAYVVYVGFDAVGEKPEKKPPPKSAKRSAK